MRNVVAKFQESDSMASKKRRRLRIVDKTAQIEVFGEFAINLNLSAREAASAIGWWRKSMRKVLKHHKFHLYKIQHHQELNEDEPVRTSDVQEKSGQA